MKCRKALGWFLRFVTILTVTLFLVTTLDACFTWFDRVCDLGVSARVLERYCAVLDLPHVSPSCLAGSRCSQPKPKGPCAYIVYTVVCTGYQGFGHV